ncbi:MAG: hypothetical protein IJ415_04735 [Clostridia bacterium]|nr:hypothetical protein [Clostridia bacterium]
MSFIIYDDKISKQKLLGLNIHIDDNVKIGTNVKIWSGTKIFKDSIIEDNCELGVNSIINNSHLKQNVKVLSSFVEQCVVDENTTIGPFATLKKGSEIGKGCRIGNFVEIKNSMIGNNVKIAHLTYVGDSIIGNECNIGCGVVFCNYDGAVKRKSVVGEKVFIGSNVNIIAPVCIGDGAYIAAGSTINKDVEFKQFAIARAYQINKDNFNNPYFNKF